MYIFQTLQNAFKHLKSNYIQYFPIPNICPVLSCSATKTSLFPGPQPRFPWSGEIRGPAAASHHSRKHLWKMFTCSEVFKGPSVDGYWLCGIQLVGCKVCLLVNSMTGSVD